jgi:hypothetical protein
MLGKKYILLWVLILSILSLVFSGCGGSANQSITFSELIAQADKYNGKMVTLEAYYFSGFEISAISESVGPANSGAWRIVPTGTLVWVKGGISQELQGKLYAQTATPSGYTERLGKLKITGKFETGKYGHLDAYLYQITIINAEVLDWSPPPAAASPQEPTSSSPIQMAQPHGGTNQGQLTQFADQTNDLPLEIISLTSPVSPGQIVTLIAQTIPGAICKITVDYRALPSDFRSFYAQTADKDGRVTWTWMTGKSSGAWQIEIKVSYGGNTTSTMTLLIVQ